MRLLLVNHGSKRARNTFIVNIVTSGFFVAVTDSVQVSQFMCITGSSLPSGKCSVICFSVLYLIQVSIN